MTTRPPDDWNDDDTADRLPPRASPPPAGRPALDPRAEALRAAWVEAVRAFYARQTGRPSRYDSDPRWDGGVKRTSTAAGVIRYRPVWPGIVARADAAGVSDPVDLVRVLFAGWASDTPPVPTMLYRTDTLDAARKLPVARRARIALALSAEEAVFRMAAWAAGLTTPDPAAAVAYVLNDVGRDLSPLFRYSLAVVRGLPAVAERWAAAARSQFLQDPGTYLTYWSNIIPTDLKQAAARAAGTTT